MRNTHTFSATPTPAEAVTPKVFTMVWITRKEVPTSSSCRATGRPSLSSSAMMRPSKRTLRREKWTGSRSFRRWMTARETTTLTAWAATVARAAPAAPR